MEAEDLIKFIAILGLFGFLLVSPSIFMNRKTKEMKKKQIIIRKYKKWRVSQRRLKS